MNLKKIVVVYECLISGGTDRLLIHLIKNWPDKKTKWILYLKKNNSGISLFKEEFLKTNVKINIYSVGTNFLNKSVNQFYLIKAIRKIYRIPFKWINIIRLVIYFRKQLIAECPDLLFLHNGGYPGSADVHAASIAMYGINRMRIIMGIQNIPSLTGSGLKSLFLNMINSHFVDAFIFGNERSKAVYEKCTNLDKNKFYSINEGVNVNQNNLRKEKFDGLFRIGMIGSYEERKGHIILFRAINILKSYTDLNKINFKVICYGQSKYGKYKEIRKKVIDYGIAHLIEYKEYEKDMDKLYLPLDIIVLPSIDFETMPLVLIDAQAYYKPIIGSRLQGIIDIIDHGINGYLFPIGDHRKLAHYIRLLILDSEKRIDFGIQGRKKYELNFSAKTMCNSYARVFNN